MIFILICDDGTEEAFRSSDSAQRIARFIQSHNVERIVVGEITDDNIVKWEKQFSAITVLPSNFGKQ